MAKEMTGPTTDDEALHLLPRCRLHQQVVVDRCRLRKGCHEISFIREEAKPRDIL